jgi:hypothetical protein
VGLITERQDGDRFVLSPAARFKTEREIEEYRRLQPFEPWQYGRGHRDCCQSRKDAPAPIQYSARDFRFFL